MLKILKSIRNSLLIFNFIFRQSNVEAKNSKDVSNTEGQIRKLSLIKKNIL